MNDAVQAALEDGRARLLRGDTAGALATFESAYAQQPDAGSLLLALAGTCWQAQQYTRAETLLRHWLDAHGTDADAALLLARLLQEQGRAQAAAQVCRALFAQARQPVDTLLQVVELLEGHGRAEDAAALCEAEIRAGSTDARVHAYAGMLALELGQYERVRERYAFALANAPEAVDWNIPIGLSTLQRYSDPSHPDLAFFRDVLATPALNENTRTTTLFALAKANDDLGHTAEAARLFAEANARAHAARPWPRKAWKRMADARLAGTSPPFTLEADASWTPVFVVGVPRSGTTLLAEQLAKHPGVCNRGELGWLDLTARQLETAPRVREVFEQAAARYAAQLRQDDGDATWFIDKQPLNLLHVDLILALWPNAKIVYCQRNARDTALSLWMQSFSDPAHDYAYDMADIGLVIHQSRRLMAHWQRRFPHAIHTVRYEALAADPEATVGTLLEWLGVPTREGIATSAPQAIRTASAWQARQPAHTRSVGRWRDYTALIPELSNLPDD
ncbi:sulfotransferase [Dyella sp. C11]|uniref:tetratricopeptide repeat-containing sulfotransferase family protein n=1 Tax=Dyella sp. C11 TaxID=2126991 RepID=UPI001E360D4E|nr:sulfotransferase [Dyella sp. C11]